MKERVFLIIFTSVIWMVSTEDYCHIDCQGQPHIGCHNKGHLSEGCDKNSKIIAMNDKLKEKFLKVHNELRNKVAAGKLSNFESASHMGAMAWDNELSTLAVFNVKKCDMKHDKCRNTKHYKFAGQTVASWVGSPAISPERAIDHAFQLWYSQNYDTTMSAINSNKPNGKNIGHFLTLVNERNNRVGCAILTTNRWRMPAYFITCNYPRNNINGEQVYKSGSPASECTSGKDSKYHNLCSTSEKYNV